MLAHACNILTKKLLLACCLETPSVQVVNAMDAMGNAVFSDGMSLVFTLTITNLANSKAGLAVASVRARPTSSHAVPPTALGGFS